MGGPLHAPDRFNSVTDSQTARGRLAGLHGLPEVIADDPQVRHLFDDPVLGLVHSRLPFAGVRVLDEPLPVPDQTAQIKLIVQDAGAALVVAVDGG